MRSSAHGRRNHDERAPVGGSGSGAGWRDPRRIVVGIAVGALVFGAVALSLLLGATRETRSSVQYLDAQIQAPKDHLLAAERASENGQAALAAAVGATGDDRTRLLSEAIVASQTMTSEWRKYQTGSIGLPGEAPLAAAYEADQAKAQAVSSAILVPILNATTSGSLPKDELDTHQAVRADLVALHTLYRDADRAAFSSLESHTARSQQGLIIGALILLAVVAFGAYFGLRLARRTVADRAERLTASALAAFETRLRRALELIDTSDAAFRIAERGIAEMLPEARSSVMIADSSRARLTPVGEEPVCGVASPEECPALRSGSTVTFPDSRALDACPVLALNAEQPCSATCVPIAVAGRGSAIVHLVGRVGHLPDSHGATELVARGVGDRVTLLQALATFQLQAERDPLTGLLNRRSLETAVEQVLSTGQQYSVAFGDLDHFKQLNDLHGHEAGDRALRAFSRTLRESLRPEDITCRWGGEEFVIVLPNCDAATAVVAMERVRTNLALGSIAGQATAVTVSFGVAHSTDGHSFDEIVERADDALRNAKETGRNRVVCYEPALLHVGDVLTS